MLRHVAGFLPDESIALDDAWENATPVGASKMNHGNISAISGSTLVPQSAVLELATGPKKNYWPSRMQVKARECWLSQTKYYVNAKYTGGENKKKPQSSTSTRIQVQVNPKNIHFRNMKYEDFGWAGENGEAVHEFHDLLSDLLERILSRVVAGDGSAFMVEYGSRGSDIAITPSDTRALSDELYERVKCAEEM